MKYGFKKDSFRVGDLKDLGALMHFLEQYPKESYLAEFVGLKHDDFRLYTDEQEIAVAIATRFVVNQ